MASFRFHGNRWQARVRRKGYSDQTKSFLTRQDAERWARSIEVEFDRGIFIDQSAAQSTTFGEVIQRYMKEVLPSNVLELSAVTGHKQLNMLKRYYHPNPEVLALKLV